MLGYGGDPTATRGGGGDGPGRGPGHRIQAGHLTAGEDSVDEGVSIHAPLHRQWDRVMVAGMERFHISGLQNKAI